MPHEPPVHATRYESLIDAIRRYLATHPAAADTVEGIAGWAVGAVASVTADEVRSALTPWKRAVKSQNAVPPGGVEVFARTDALARAAERCASASTSAARRPRSSRSTRTAGRSCGAGMPTPPATTTPCSRSSRRSSRMRSRRAARVPARQVSVSARRDRSRARPAFCAARTPCASTAMPIKRDLEARLGRPIAMANDANCFALSEATDGAGRGAGVVFGVILGTGVGGGHRRPRSRARRAQRRSPANGDTIHAAVARTTTSGRDRHASAASTGASRRGCRVRALARDHHARVPRRAHRRRRRSSPAPAQQDAACDATLARYEERLARALAHVINIVDPDVIVLGGGLSNVDAFVRIGAAAMGPAGCSPTASIRNLYAHAHGDSSGVRGAAWLAA